MIIIAKMLNMRHKGPLSNALNKAGICHPGTQKYAERSDKQIAITDPPGTVGTGTEPGFHR